MDMALESVERDGNGPWELPEGWAWTQLGAVLPIAYGKALPDRDRSGSGEYPVFGSSGPVGSHNEFIAPANSIMVGRKGSAGSVFLSETPAWPIDTAYFTSGCTAIDIRYGYWYLWFRKLGRLDQSTAIPSLSRDIYDVQPIPLAPLAEQRRIVARVDALFAEIAEGEAALEAARKGLDTFRRALLKAAVTGELTKDWRENNPVTDTGHDLLARIKAQRAAKGQAKGRGKRAADAPPLDIAALPELPAGWAWGTVRNVADVMGGLTKNPDREKMAGRAKYLRVANVQAGSLDLTEMKEIGVTAEDRQRASLQPGDLLVVEGNGSIDQIGRCALWDGEIADCVHQNHIIKVRFDDPHMPRWCFKWLLSPHGRQEIEQVAASTSGLHTLSISKIEALPIPIPPPAEAAEILRRVSETLAASADTLAMLDAEAADAARLKQSILKAAFEGRLVPQDPADEPASTMLARLRATPFTATPARRGRGRR